MVQEQVLAGLLACREEGLGFEEAWLRTVGREGLRASVRFPHDTVERRGWRKALVSTRNEWRAGYEGRDTALSRALAAAGEAADLALDGSSSVAPRGQGVIRLAYVLPPASIATPLPDRVAA
jgi:hypothetical protein